MATLTLPQNNNRIPLQPSSSTVANLIYPTDLVSSNRDMYMIINLNTYNGYNVTQPVSLQNYIQIALPVPIKMNDQTTINWEQSSIVTLAAAAASATLGGLGSLGATINTLITRYGSVANALAQAYSARSVNQFMIMLFKTQNFKEHVMQWLFAPNNQQDTDNLHDIIEYLKAASLPSIVPDTLTVGLQYPDIATVAFNVPINSTGNQQSYLYNIKPCAITNIMVDWSAGTTPAFFENGAPALVSVTIQLKEIELWFKTGPGTYA